MLKLSVDAFSGRPNPTWVLEDDDAQEILAEISQHKDAVTDVTTGYDGLGFRGVILEPLSDEFSEEYDLPDIMKIGGGESENKEKGLELSEQIIKSMQKYFDTAAFVDTPIPFDPGLEEYLMGLLDLAAERKGGSDVDTPESVESPPEAAAVCYIERWRFNPDFWNRSEVIRRNNCYNYASNWRTDTFAQPGRGSGSMYTALTCAEVTRAALSDGCHHRYHCFPHSERPRFVLALVVAPGWDYHWYRLHTRAEGFWGHKPGGTAARNTDNRGAIVRNPITCSREPYTEFCGYFYGCNSQRRRIR